MGPKKVGFFAPTDSADLLHGPGQFGDRYIRQNDHFCSTYIQTTHRGAANKQQKNSLRDRASYNIYEDTCDTRYYECTTSTTVYII